MKNSKLSGWKEVFSFTLKQTFKSKTYRISYVILMVITLLSMPIVGKLLSGDNEDSNATSPIEKVYVYNATTLSNVDFTNQITDERMKHIYFEQTTEDYDAVSKRVEEEEKTSVILTISESNDMFSLHFLKASKGPVKDSHVQTLGDVLMEQFKVLRINSLGITEEQNAILNAQINTNVSSTDINGEAVLEEDTSISMSEYWFVYGILFFVMMANSLAGSQVTSSIVTEKSTRVVEYLLITVKPLALMFGKILAMLLATLFQMLSMIVAFFISNRISSAINPNNMGIMEQLLPKDIFQNLNIINLFFCLVLVMLGMIFYATLAGLAGATVSRIEELSEGLTLFTFTNLIGVYIGLGAVGTLMGAGINAYVIFTFLFPLSSPFILPGAILVGKTNILLILLAIVLELLFIMLLFRFVAKVYETLILHNGNKIKMKELLHLSKTV